MNKAIIIAELAKVEFYAQEVGVEIRKEAVSPLLAIEKIAAMIKSSLGILQTTVDGMSDTYPDFNGLVELKIRAQELINYLE